MHMHACMCVCDSCDMWRYRFFLPSVKKQKIEMIWADNEQWEIVTIMKNAPILDFHCVARKLK